MTRCPPPVALRKLVLALSLALACALGMLIRPVTALAAAPVPTSTVLSVPVTAVAGTPMVLSITVTAPGLPAGTVASGRVDVLAGGSTVATAPVTGLTSAPSGVTVPVTATVPTPGTSALVAVFVPTDPTLLAGSASSVGTVVVNTVVGVLVITSPQLSVTPAAPTTADAVTLAVQLTSLNADVPPYPTGLVTFLDAGTVVGTAFTDASGRATFTLTSVAAGSHSYTATFAPTDPTTFYASTSAPVTRTVTAAPSAPLNGVQGEGEDIIATVASGTLVLTAATSVDLGVLALDPAAGRLVAPAGVSLAPVTITDTRAGQLGYTVSGFADDLVSGSGSRIDGANLGWTPQIAGAVPAAVNVSAGPAVASADGLAVGAVPAAGTGLKQPRVLATSSYDPASGKGSVGSVSVTAGLDLRAPTTTAPGVYRTTLVLTAI